jgi:DNA-binding response OmpR family regulator
MNTPKELTAILIIEDDLDVAEMLNSYFRIQGYDVLTVNWGEDGLNAAETSRPDLIILDIRLPDIDGFEVAQKLRANRNTREIPILFLTEKRERKDRLHGLEVGGDDYITKPFDIQELRLRVRNALSRVGQPPLHNPVTDLPQPTLMDERLSKLLKQDGWALIAIRLENLDSFREQYSFIAADNALRATGVLMLNTLRDFGSPNDLLGHLTADQFLVVTTANKANQLLEKITTRITQSLDFHYPAEDLEKIKGLETRLALRTALLKANQGPFVDLNSLKSSLLSQKQR